MSPIDRRRNVCQWLSSAEAFHHFATYTGATQSQEHIKPVHWYVACRLVIEGGFHPDDVVPRPPFEVDRRGGRALLRYAPDSANNAERTLLGGLKTKAVDVVVTKDGLGPVIAVSCKGMTGALRNLTNRMEETIGECTNIHITYPALVFGYLFLIRANQMTANQTTAIGLLGAAEEAESPTRQLKMNDMALEVGGEPVESVVRFKSALVEMGGRQGIRSELSRYESISLALVDMEPTRLGTALGSFPAEPLLRFEQFFSTIYQRYDERFVYAAPSLETTTRRIEWAPNSPALQPDSLPGDLDYEPRTT